ncbi:MAG: FAD-binding dehydrogenase [Bacteroidota bacterium]
MSQTDVLIVGAGLAGMTAAIELLDAGLRVVILDRAPQDTMGGLARWSMGGLFYVDSPFQRKAKIEDSHARAFEDWCSAAEFGPEDHLPKQWAEQYITHCIPYVYEWLKPKGTKYIPSVQWIERGHQRKGNSVPRFHVVWGAGKTLTETVKQHLLQHPSVHNLTLQFDQQVEALHLGRQTHRATGYNLISGTPFEWEASAIILAAGGITGSVEKVKQHWNPEVGPTPEYMLSGSHLWADGQIHDVAAQVGAKITHLQNQWNYAAGVHHPDAEHPLHGLSLIPPKTALWVNAEGKRIGPLITGFDTRHLVSEICQQPGQYSWQILNYKTALKELGVSGSLYNEAMANQNTLGFIRNILFGNKSLVQTMLDRCRDFVTGGSVEELVQNMNALTGTSQVSVEQLKRDIQAFDHALEAGENSQDEQVQRIGQLRSYRGDKLRTTKYQRIMDPSAMPLIAIRAFILTRKSMGGIQTDLRSRVVDQNGAVIEGLYAVGENAGFGGGGIHGKRALEGTFLGNCIFTARVAAKDLTGQTVQGAAKSKQAFAS